MIDATFVPQVAPTEILARFVLQRRDVRSSDHSVEPDAFIPQPNRATSVTRHLQAVADELWNEGFRVANLRGRTLVGRADFAAQAALDGGLTVLASPLDDNPNHADIVGWPAEKAMQKIIALEIAASATFVGAPLERLQ